jgi:hydrogenase maturation protease
MPDKGRRSVVIGIGNPDRGDDSAGRAVARWLDGKLPPDVEILEHDGEPASLLDRLEGVATAYLIDACTSGAAIGAVQRFDVTAVPLPQEAFSVSTHGLGLAEAVELARALGQLPDRCVVYAIEGGSFETGAPPSPPVVQATAEVGRRLQEEICGADAREGRIDA